MRLASLILLAVVLPTKSYSQTTAERYRSANKIWLAHRHDGMTWDDGSPEAAAALNAMWAAVIDEANDYVVKHTSATSKQIEHDLIAIDPETDKRFGPPLSVTVLKLEASLFAVSVTNYTASTVFVLRPNLAKPQVWRLNQAAEQANDPKGLLQAWRSERADDPCRDKEPKGTYGTCGPVSGTVGILAPESTGAPRFFVDAVYSKDMGALVLKQTSVWRWNGEQAQLLWIDDYNFSMDVDGGVHYKNGELSIIEKRFPHTFSSCNGCFEPTTLHRIRLMPDAIDDIGETSRVPQLDLIDDLFWRFVHNMSTESIATPQVVASLREPILKAVSYSESDGPDSAYIGMLDDWSVAPTKDGSRVCFIAGDLDRIDFTLRRLPHQRLRITKAAQNSNRPCSASRTTVKVRN